MSKAIKLFLAIFASYRLAAMITHDEGPYLPFIYQDERQTGFFEWMRTKLGVYDYGPDGLPETNLARGISCPLCVGVYISLLIALLLRPKSPVKLFLYWLGISGAQVFLENLTSDEAIQSAIEDVAESMDES